MTNRIMLGLILLAQIAILLALAWTPYRIGYATAKACIEGQQAVLEVYKQKPVQDRIE